MRYAGLLHYVNDELEHLITADLNTLGFDLVELRRGGTKARPLIEVRIDRRDGGKVGVDDCARASRALEARLDSSPLVSERYVLQVSSPGERLLRTLQDWARFSGQWVRVLRSTATGRERFEARIVATSAGDAVPSAQAAGEGRGEVEVELEGGERRRLSLADVKEARLAFRW